MVACLHQESRLGQIILSRDGFEDAVFQLGVEEANPCRVAGEHKVCEGINLKESDVHEWFPPLRLIPLVRNDLRAVAWLTTVAR